MSSSSSFATRQHKFTYDLAGCHPGTLAEVLVSILHRAFKDAMPNRHTELKLVSCTTHSSNCTARSQAAPNTDQQKLCIFLQPGCRYVYSRHCTEEVHLVCCHTIGLLVEHGGQILVPKLVYVGTSYGKRRPGNRMHRGELSSIHLR